MAFGDAAVLIDDFNRANVDPITGGPGWTNPFGFPTSGMQSNRILSNECAQHSGVA